MSMDNGIYIGHFNDGYRVIYAQAIENIYEGPEFIKDYFGNVSPLKTLDDAYDKAKRIEKDLMVCCEHTNYPYSLEYGIQILELGKWPK